MQTLVAFAWVDQADPDLWWAPRGQAGAGPLPRQEGLAGGDAGTALGVEERVFVSVAEGAVVDEEVFFAHFGAFLFGWGGDRNYKKGEKKPLRENRSEMVEGRQWW